ncbi:MAG TPA: methyltransferase [Gammaproteobacteria bacterium]|nr:methyltransferase [Gammaproteobacteria bacterium]
MKPWILSTALLAAGLIAAPAAAHNHNALADAIAGDHRAAVNVTRDDSRHPKQTLEFFGFEEDLTIVEIWPGGGWYTEILAPAVRDHGKLIAAHFPEDTDSAYMKSSRAAFMAMLESAPGIYDQVEVIGYAPPEDSLGEPGSADMVLTFRSIHGFMRQDSLDAFLEDAFAVLKSGGVLGVVQHRAPEGAEPEAAEQTGYVPQAWLVEQVEAVGFELDASSEINANPKDTADHPRGVWTLAPTYRLGDENRTKYEEIGESDRMTLRFVKP